MSRCVAEPFSTDTSTLISLELRLVGPTSEVEVWDLRPVLYYLLL